MIPDLSKISQKFYKDSEIWDLAKYHETQINEFLHKTKDFLIELHYKGYVFRVYKINEYSKLLHCSLTYCCGPKKGNVVETKIRKEIVEPYIYNQTMYKIVWEDLLQLKELKNEIDNMDS